MAYANPTVTGLLELPVTRKQQKVPPPLTFVVSHPDGECTLMENPQGYGDMNGQELTFDSSALYPQLWINDSEGPHPTALMCSAKFQAAHREQSEKCALNALQYSVTVTVNVGTALLGMLLLLPFRNQLCVKGKRGNTVGSKVRLNTMCRTVR